MSNMELWDRAFKTDPAQVKPITGKQYNGNSPKPYYIVQKATEIFGACGIGWGVTVVTERFERLTDTDVLHVALVRVWYLHGDKRGDIEQMGQTKAAYKTKDGKMMVDEDAPKKSVTDGMVKCLSMIGFAGDIFSGRWDDSKYQDELKSDFPPSGNVPKAPPPAKIPSNQTIGDAEFKVLNDYLDETGTDKSAFCKHFEITSVSALPLAKYATAVSMLKKKLKSIQQTRAKDITP
jgi:hypothetical protein